MADVQGRPLRLDEALEGRIWRIVEPLRERFRDLDPDALRAGARKQALVPEGAAVLEPVGTAPGLVVPPAEGRDGPVVVVLPGPPRELQGCGPRPRPARPSGRRSRARRRTASGCCASSGSRSPRSPRRCASRPARGSTSTRWRSRRACGGARSRSSPGGSRPPTPVYERFEAVVRRRHADTLFSDDGSSVDEQVARLLLGRGWTIATAESCTGGLLAGRLTERAGSSAYVLGGLVVYADAAKVALAGVDPALIAAHGAVSTEVAEALADGARSALGADVGVGITGVAGPGGGTEEKPVGTVCFSVATGAGDRLTRRAHLPGGRADVRDRSTTVALHLARRVLLGEGDARAQGGGPAAAGTAPPA